MNFSCPTGKVSGADAGFACCARFVVLLCSALLSAAWGWGCYFLFCTFGAVKFYFCGSGFYFLLLYFLLFTFSFLLFTFGAAAAAAAVTAEHAAASTASASASVVTTT